MTLRAWLSRCLQWRIGWGWLVFVLLFPLGGAIATAPASGHLPLFCIDGTSQAHIALALFVLSVVAMSVLFAWLVDHTAGSVVGALVLHTANNFWPAVVPVWPTALSYRA